MRPLVRGSLGATGALVVFAVGTVAITSTATMAAKSFISYRQVKLLVTIRQLRLFATFSISALSQRVILVDSKCFYGRRKRLL